MKKVKIRENSRERAFSTPEIKMFKILNREKENLGTKEDLISFIRTMLRAVGFDQDDAPRLYYLFSANYRPDGKYEDIMMGDEKSLLGLRPERTSNIKASIFAKSKIPFKGSNLEGFWEKDPSGKLQYIITSYNWYPIYIYKNNKWYRVTESYSKSTSKQMSNTRIWGDKIVDLTANQMNQLRRGVREEEINEDKFEQLYESLRSYYEGRNYIFISAENYPLSQHGYPSDRVRFKFRVNNLEKNDNVNLGVDMLEIAFKDRNGKIITRVRPENTPNFEAKMSELFTTRIFANLPSELRKTAKDKLNIDINFVE
jgi:hypothetical protein